MKILDIMIEYITTYKSSNVSELGTIHDCLHILKEYKKDNNKDTLGYIPRCPSSLLEDLFKEKGYNIHDNVIAEWDAALECLGQEYDSDNEEQCLTCWDKFVNRNIDKTNGTFIGGSDC